jgi:hypothetical protein
MNRHPSLARLRDPGVCSQVAPEEWQLGVIFDNDGNLTSAIDNLRALALGQAGGYSHQQIIAWMHRRTLTLDAAADALARAAAG